jgi:hypothetical protein
MCSSGIGAIGSLAEKNMQKTVFRTMVREGRFRLLLNHQQGAAELPDGAPNRGGGR